MILKGYPVQDPSCASLRNQDRIRPLLHLKEPMNYRKESLRLLDSGDLISISRSIVDVNLTDNDISKVNFAVLNNAMKNFCPSF